MRSGIIGINFLFYFWRYWKDFQASFIRLILKWSCMKALFSKNHENLLNNFDTSKCFMICTILCLLQNIINLLQKRLLLKINHKKINYKTIFTLTNVSVYCVNFGNTDIFNPCRISLLGALGCSSLGVLWGVHPMRPWP